MEIGLRLKLVGNPQQSCLAKGTTLQLQSDWQIVRINPARDRNGWEPGQVGCDGINIGQVHGQRIVYPLANLERRARCGWTKDYIDFVQRPVEILLDQPSYFGCANIVLVVIPRTECKRSQKYPAFDFLAEVIRASFAIHLVQFS